MFGTFGTHRKASTLLIFLILTIENQALEDVEPGKLKDESAHILQNQNPSLEVLGLSSEFRNIDSLKNAFRTKPDPTIEKTSENYDKANPRSVLALRTYEISRSGISEPEESIIKEKREVDQKSAQKPVPQSLVSTLTEAEFGGKYSSREESAQMPDALSLRSPTYTTYSIKHFDDVDPDDRSHSKLRRNDSAEVREDYPQRDKRTFLDGGNAGSSGNGKVEGDNGDATTTLPYWKRKKDNPQFITGRGSTPKGNDYSPPQHRSLDSARESHSMKNLEKTAQGNDVGKSNQDNYYSSTVRRTYNRPSDTVTSPAPKSVYDTLDYNSNRRNQDAGRMASSGYREGRVSHEPYRNRPYNVDYPTYDRPYYQSQPFTYDVLGRGVEYYHRNYEPSSGRIVYYANMPEYGRTMDYRSPEPVNRNFYVQRPTPYESYYMNYVPPYDYVYTNQMIRTPDYARADRSNPQPNYYQERIKYQREPRYSGGHDKTNQFPDFVRNKTYIIYDADERSHFGKVQYPSDVNRLEHNLPFNYYQGPQEPSRKFENFPANYHAPSEYSVRKKHSYPAPYSGSSWGFNQGIQPNAKWQVDSNVNPNYRFLNSPNVQLPLSTTINRNFHFRDSDKISKKA